MGGGGETLQACYLSQACIWLSFAFCPSNAETARSCVADLRQGGILWWAAANLPDFCGCVGGGWSRHAVVAQPSPGQGVQGVPEERRTVRGQNSARLILPAPVGVHAGRTSGE